MRASPPASIVCVCMIQLYPSRPIIGRINECSSPTYPVGDVGSTRGGPANSFSSVRMVESRVALSTARNASAKPSAPIQKPRPRGRDVARANLRVDLFGQGGALARGNALGEIYGERAAVP